MVSHPVRYCSRLCAGYRSMFREKILSAKIIMTNYGSEVIALRVTPAKPNITVTKQCPYRLVHFPDLPSQNKRTNDNDVLPRQYVRPAMVVSRAIDRFASQQSRRPLPTTTMTTPLPRVRNGRTGRPTAAWRHASPPRVMPCGLDWA
jgi:hypothetical protein